MRRPSGEAGASLIEMLITIVIFGVVGTVVTTVTVTGMHDQVRITSHSEQIAEVRTTLDRVTREIRDADDLGAVTSSGLTVYQDNGTGHKKLVYAVVPNGTTSKLTLDVSYLNSSYGVTANDAQRTLVENLVDTSTQPVFAYRPWPNYTPATGSTVSAATCADSAHPGYYGAECVGSITLHVRDSVPNTNEVIDVTDSITRRNSS